MESYGEDTPETNKSGFDFDEKELRDERLALGISPDTIKIVCEQSAGKYYYDHISKPQQELYAEVYLLLKNHGEDVLVDAPDEASIGSVFLCVLNDHPEIYYTEGYGYRKYTVGGKVFFTMSGKYIYSKDECAFYDQKLEEATRAYLSGFTKYDNEYTRVKSVYTKVIKQTKYDKQYILTSLDFTRHLFDQDNRLSSLELRLRPGSDFEAVKTEMQRLAEGRFHVYDRYEQQDDTFRIMKVEKLMAYIFLTFILIIACFNIIGSLSMLIIDKRSDVATLSSLGASEHQIIRIFLFEGRMISLMGAVIGILLGLLLCWLQQEYGLVRLGNSEGSFVIDAYPVSVHPWDVVLIFITVVVVGFLSVWYPVRYLSKRLLRR